MRQTKQLSFVWFLLASSLIGMPAFGMSKPYPGPFIERPDLLIVLRQHAPEQIAAFYEARGFPAAAIERIKATCFVTVHIKNRGDDVIWLDLAEWAFTRKDKPLERLDRSYWDNQWDSIKLRQASRSTFGWTQLPDVRDLQPDEPVGGNLVFPGNTDRFDMKLKLPTGVDRQGEPIMLEFRDVECLKEVKAE
ncbi:MAG: hypothetical protein KJO10_05125 [Gammaproteobacteria bacterium]|nr:hypothetical protein [Gammaproteobacteria bacterium]